MNQGKLEVVKLEMARVNIDILGISELKWNKMGEINSDDHYIYYCGQESLRRDGVSLVVNRRVWKAGQFSSVTQSCLTLCDPMNRSTNSQSSPKPMSIESVMLFSHLILCRPLLLLPPIPPSIRVFSNESTLCMRWPNYWSFSFNISPSNEYPKLISFRMDWLDFLAVHGTLKIGAQLTL